MKRKFHVRFGGRPSEKCPTGQLVGGLPYECEAMRYGVDPDVDRDELAALVEGSTVELAREEHRAGHSEDFAGWGRREGIRTLYLYGAPWFSLLARRRWERITAEALAEAFATMGGRS